MSDENQEVLEEDILEDAVEETEEDLQEFKATGDPSEVPEPTAVKAKPVPGSKTQGDLKPMTKIGMISAMVGMMSKEPKTKINAMYGEMMKKAEGYHEGMHKKEGMHKEMAHAKKENMHYGKKMKKEDIDFSDDVAALFGDEDLSEQFKEKATTIFESAVLSKINEQLEEMAEIAEVQKTLEIEEAHSEMTDKLNSYLDYVVEQWLTDNRIAVENGIRTEIAEEFMGGLKKLFEESYIEMPEEKVDVLSDLYDEKESLEEELNKELKKNIELSEQIEELHKTTVISELSEGLTDLQVEKMKSLSEGVDFISVDDFAEKVGMLKENYFNSDEEQTTETIFDEDEPLEEEATSPRVTGEMAQYMSAISRTVKK